MASKEEDEQEKTIAEDVVVTKYQTAAEVTNSKLIKSVSGWKHRGRYICRSTLRYEFYRFVWLGYEIN